MSDPNPDIRITDDYAKEIVAEEQRRRGQKTASKTATQMLAEYAAQLAIQRQIRQGQTRRTKRTPVPA